MTGADGNGEVSKKAPLVGGGESESLPREVTVLARKGGQWTLVAKQVA
ncbi:MAG: hypothetical protein MUC83_15930 [Pirellula sp.]|jgi:hypothetical protein|nr:hypothetical protein [Pirellula sp.]